MTLLLVLARERQAESDQAGDVIVECACWMKTKRSAFECLEEKQKCMERRYKKHSFRIFPLYSICFLLNLF